MTVSASLHRPRGLELDARAVVLWSVVVVASAFLVRQTYGLVVLSVYVCLLAIAAGGARPLVARVMKLAPFVALVVVLNGVLVEGSPVGDLPLVSAQGLRAGLHSSMRLLIVVSLATLVENVSSPEQLATGVSGLLRPISGAAAEAFAFHCFVIASFAPLLGDELRRIRTAQAFRGADIGGGLLNRVRSSQLLLIPLILSAVHRSAQLAAVVEVRRIRENIPMLLAGSRIRMRDTGFVLLAVVVSVFAITLG